MIPVVLASGSPRREELLRRLFSEFEVLPAEVDEDALTDPDPWITAQRLAREKALSVREIRPECLVIGGDTVVALAEGDGWRQLAKPLDRDDAARMLSELSGRTHKVVTGVCLVAPSGMSAFTETTDVTFRRIAREEIEAYVATGAPLDKAGAYGLQDASQDFVAQVAGSVTNVIGLPMEKLEEEIRRFHLLE
jgi:septum formation protein